MLEFILYTINGCHKCQIVREHLENLNIHYKEVNILQRKEAAKVIQNRIGEVRVPVLLVDHEIIWGKDLLKLSNNKSTTTDYK